MRMSVHRIIATAVAAAVVALGAGAARTAGAHCDTLDGPVVVDARAALAAGAVEPGIAAADRAIDSGSADGLVAALTEHLDEGVRHRFERVVAAREHAGHNVAAGRTYVAAYVDFIHYVEGLHVAMAGSGHGAAPAGYDAHAH